ncbi:MAG: endonuclease V [Candidatus Pacearchaeota archaeon]|nr:endonuclease V [Candidatus Pacearchaeota archaeon]
MGEEKEVAEGVIEESPEEKARKYNINIEKLEEEQKKLAKNIVLKNSIDFYLADRIAGIENIFFKNKIISAIVVMVDGEIVEQEYFEDKIRFPYIPGLRAYRELPNMMQAFNKLDEKPDVIFVRGHGVIHPNGLGIASHFSLASGIPTIGVADSLIVGQIQGEDIIFNEKKAGKVLKVKEGANPIFISPGSMISVESAFMLAKNNIQEGHKIPEVLRLARKYAKEIMKELYLN